MNVLVNATNKQLEDSSESFERWALISAGLVILGLIAEFVIAVCHPEYDSFWERWGSVVADVSVAIGVAGEVLFGRMGHRRDAELQRRTKELLANAVIKAGEANDRATKAELEIAKIKAPRVLTGEQITAIAEALRSFSGQTYDLSLPRMMEPGAALNTQLIAALRMAGWRLQSVQRSPRRMISFSEAIFTEEAPTTNGPYNFSIPNIEIGISDGWIGIFAGFEQGDSLAPHGAFLKALTDIGIEAHLGCLSEPRLGAVFPPKTDSTTVHIIIGNKN